MENEMRDLEAARNDIQAIRDSIKQQIQQTFNLDSGNFICFLFTCFHITLAF